MNQNIELSGVAKILRFMVLVVTGIFGLAICPNLAAANPLCDTWASERDGQFYNKFERVSKQYAASLSKQEVWLAELENFRAEDASWNLKAMRLVDVLITGASLTAETVSIASGISGATKAVGKNALLSGLKKTQVGLELLNARNVEEAALAHFKKQSGIKYAFKSLGVIKTALDAKNRFSDREETLKLLGRVERDLQRNLISAKRAHARMTDEQKFLIDFKNKMDGFCNRIVDSAEDCLRVGSRSDSKSYLLTNTCSKDIFVFWCIDDQRKNRCGEKDIFFAYSAKLEPSKSTYNQFSLNADFELHFGACFGSYMSLKRNVVIAPDGTYQCLELAVS